LNAANANIRSLNSQINSLNDQVTSLTNDKNSLTTQLNSVNATISSLNDQINSLNAQVTSLTNENNTLKGQITILTNERDQYKLEADKVPGLNSQINSLNSFSLWSNNNYYTFSLSESSEFLFNLNTDKISIQNNILTVQAKNRMGGYSDIIVITFDSTSKIAIKNNTYLSYTNVDSISTLKKSLLKIQDNSSSSGSFESSDISIATRIISEVRKFFN
jgi:regulator of replication initiation timing